MQVQNKLPDFHEIIDRAVAVHEGASETRAINLCGAVLQDRSCSSRENLPGISLDGSAVRNSESCRSGISGGPPPSTGNDTVHKRAPVITPAALEPSAAAALYFERSI